MRKAFLLFFALGFSFLAKAQDSGYFYGDFESNSQWLRTDNKLSFKAPEAQFRANNYFRLNYSYGKFTAGLQYEAYLPEAMLGYDPIYNGEDGISNYYLNYRDEMLDITAGYFYEQYGSGLILRSYENRQLGINNALRGVRVKFTPTDFITIKGDYGRQRYGFGLSDGLVQGVDAKVDLSRLFDIKKWFIDIGGSYVGRFQEEEQADTLPNTTNAYGARIDISKGKFYGGAEYVQLDKMALVNDGAVQNPRLFDGNALQVNLGFAMSGLSIDGTFRRLDNFSFYSDRMAEGNQYNQELINYVPALTKQQDYLLANIYVYQSQPRLFFDKSNPFEARSGEVGTQWDVYYTAKKGTAIGGKYGTMFAGNFSYYQGLDTEFDFDQNLYKTEFIGEGTRYYRDFNFEIKKRWTESWSSIFTYLNQIIDEGVANGGPLGTQGDIEAQTGIIENTYEFGGGRSIRLELQHLWTEQDRKNWAAGMLEFNYNTNISVFVSDSWNYGGEGKIHYYSFGANYTKGRARFGLRYGRQRGGLLCVGGVCRYVPSSSGLTMNLSVSF